MDMCISTLNPKHANRLLFEVPTNGDGELKKLNSHSHTYFPAHPLAQNSRRAWTDSAGTLQTTKVIFAGIVNGYCGFARENLPGDVTIQLAMALPQQLYLCNSATQTRTLANHSY